MESNGWKKSACILCECNCGIEIELGGDDGRRFQKIRGDKAHPDSAGYTCEKPLRLDHYQNGRHRLTSPLRRKADGSYEEIDWDTAIREIAARLRDVCDRYGGDKLLFYGGGGQGNHMGGSHGRSLMYALGARYQSNAIAQEKTGEGLVDEIMYGGHTRGDFEHTEVAVFLGKNPWQSHGISRARPTLREIARDPDRAMIVLDPRRTETAEMADYHLQVKNGSDAWCLAAMLGVLVQEDLVNHAWLAEHTHGAKQVLATLAQIPVADYAQRCGVPEETIRAATRRIARANSVSTYEDLGVEQGPNSTLISYLQKLLWILTGNYAKQGAMAMHSWMFPIAGPVGIARDPQTNRRGDGARRLVANLSRRARLAGMRRSAPVLVRAMPALSRRPRLARMFNAFARWGLGRTVEAVGPTIVWDIVPRLQFDPDPLLFRRDMPATREWFDTQLPRTPVTRAPVIAGMIPAAAIADEILTDHPDRFRALWIEASNPAHSLPDSPRFREAIDALDLVVVIDVAFTETARRADYVLPAASQFEKWEFSMFTLDFPRNTFQLRAPVLAPVPGTRPECDIYAALARELRVAEPALLDGLHAAASIGREAFATTFFAAIAANPQRVGVLPYLLHETLGPTLPEGTQGAAVTWAMAYFCAIAQPEAVRRAGFTGTGHEPCEKLFNAILTEHSGVTFTVDDYEHAWNYVHYTDRKIRVAIPMLLDELRGLADTAPVWSTPDYPFVLSAGERRSFSANTIYRDPAWRRRDRQGALRINPADAQRLGLKDGGRARVSTARGHADAVVELTDMMQPGHISLPNGLGLDYPGENGAPPVVTGVPPNELTSGARRDPFVGTPWHKNHPARVEALPTKDHAESNQKASVGVT